MRTHNLSFEEAQRLKEFEVTTEIDTVFPIMSNLSKVQDGDILVSDTYYNNEELSRILKKIGLTKKVHLFTSSNGKKEGSIWPQLMKRYEILSHLGDNHHSDVLSPKNYGIQGVLSTETKYSSIEENVWKMRQRDLANLMRVLRLENPYQKESTEWTIWNEQAQLNVPSLILASLYLDNFCKEKNITTLLFSARGCCHIIKIFKHLFPNYTSVYFHSSRYVYQHPTPEFIRYARSHYLPNTLIVDENGTGGTCRAFFEKHLSITPNYFSIVHASGWGSQSWRLGRIEHLNVDQMGSLICFDENDPVRLPLEYPLEYVQVAHTCIERCLSLLDQYTVNTFNEELLLYFLKTIRRSKPALEQYYIPVHKQ